MAVYTPVSAEAMAQFISRYDVGDLISAKGIAEGVENSNYMVDTTKGRFILTLYEKRVDAADLPFFMALLDHVANKGLPVPPAVPDRYGREIQELEGRPACLIKFLQGVSVSHPSSAQALAVGNALGQLHKATVDFSLKRPNTMGFERWDELYQRCGRSLDQIVSGLYDDIGFALEKIVATWPTDIDQCAIHADLFPDNVLMLGDEVTGLIDFYFACTDFRLLDVAITHAAWSFDPTGLHFNREIGDALITGYALHFPLHTAPFHYRHHFRDLAVGACIRFTLSRAWDWLNTPADALVTRKDPLAFWRRVKFYDPNLASLTKTLA
jgi:homoserine kinase type II